MIEEAVATDIIIDLLEQLLEKTGGTDTSRIEEYLDGIETDTGKIEEHTGAVVQILDHPALTTPFEEYTVTEALLLLLLVYLFITSCFRMLRGGFSWLRS